MAAKKTWKKVLYEKQPYPDNYTDKRMFLRDLRKNIDIKEISFYEAFSGSMLILQEFCNVVTFVLIYFCLLDEWVDPYTLLFTTNILTMIGFVFYLSHFKRGVKKDFGSYFRTVITFIVFGRLFSPVLHTLTDTISTDTIYTTTFTMMLVHLIFFDYGVGAAIVSNSLSLSAVIFASICLASRLSSALNAFILMTIAIEMFVLFPVLLAKMKSPLFFTAVFLFIDMYLLLKIGSLLTTLYISVVTLISLICPLLYVQYQKYKENIYGPWDEAIVDDADNIIDDLNTGVENHS
ncbi:phosphatidylinositol glycan anchor biosynthesis class C [Leptinotarsa decemlineata]|uniref:phosphatidylinositol glycan anchor biosynthesis class C n=1 Tax=Leptinotarsa decemlineata TaxID=7539 RepID=UPI003D30AC3C